MLALYPDRECFAAIDALTSLECRSLFREKSCEPNGHFWSIDIFIGNAELSTF